MRLAVGGDQNIGGLQVAMNDPPLMGVLNRFADRPHQLQDLPLRQTLFPGIFVKRDALDKLHDVVVRAVAPAALVNAGDIGMLQAGGQFYLSLEACERLL
jgi:hypothetical protein